MKQMIPILLQEGGDRRKVEALADHLKTDLLEMSHLEEVGGSIRPSLYFSSTCHETASSPSADDELPETPVYLSFGADGLTLTDGAQSMRGDFTKLKKRLQYHNLTHELLVKATKIKGREALHVIDATAGMGEDSLLLAASGCHVTLYEQDPIIAALLADTLARALEEPSLHDLVARMQLVEGNSTEALQALAKHCARPDVIYLDPMFPERQKSGLVKKKFQLLHYLEAPAEDEDALMQAAIAARPFKIVVKRPAKGPYLAGQKPSYSLDGKAIRYDCYVFPENA